MPNIKPYLHQKMKTIQGFCWLLDPSLGCAIRNSPTAILLVLLLNGRLRLNYVTTCHSEMFFVFFNQRQEIKMKRSRGTTVLHCWLPEVGGKSFSSWVGAPVFRVKEKTNNHRPLRAPQKCSKFRIFLTCQAKRTIYHY